MKENKNSILSEIVLVSILLMLNSCCGMKNSDRSTPEDNEEGTFITVRDGIKIFVYEYVPGSEFKNTIHIVSGITGINHNSEKDIIVDKAGCDEIYSAWKSQNKKYEIINGGSHGKSTVLKGAEIIINWIESI